MSVPTLILYIIGKLLRSCVPKDTKRSKEAAKRRLSFITQQIPYLRHYLTMTLWRDPESLRVTLMPVVQVLLVTGALIKSSRLFKTDVSSQPRVSRAIFRMHLLEALVRRYDHTIIVMTDIGLPTQKVLVFVVVCVNVLFVQMCCFRVTMLYTI